LEDHVLDAQFIILAGGRGEKLRPLSDDCSPSLLRINNLGRLIDFSLYNCLMAPSGNVKVLTQYLSEDVEDHIRAFWSYNYFSNFRTLEVHPGQYSYKGIFSDTADAVFQLLLGEKQQCEYTVILDANTIYKLDFMKIFEFHLSHPGQVTMGMVENAGGSQSKHDTFMIGDDSRVQGMWQGEMGQTWVDDLSGRAADQGGVFIFETDLLFKYLFANQLICSNNLLKDVIPRMIAEKQVWGYPINNPICDRVHCHRVATILDFREILLEMTVPRFRKLFPESRQKGNIPLDTIHLLARHEMEKLEAEDLSRLAVPS
jgi:glucose-1-phosphate adenylyltransferase